MIRSIVLNFSLQSLIDPLINGDGSSSSSDRRSFFGFGRNGGGGGGGGGSDPRSWVYIFLLEKLNENSCLIIVLIFNSPPGPPRRRPMGRINHASDVTVPGGCSSCRWEYIPNIDFLEFFSLYCKFF